MVNCDYLVNYDELAEEYARHRGVHPEVLRGLVQAGRLTPASGVLEIGCGAGNYIAALQAAVGCPCRGIDRSEEMLAKARARPTAVQFQTASAESLPFYHDTLDLAFSVDAIHHVQDRLAAFQEAYRVLKSGGRFCIVTDSAETIRHRRPLAVYFRETVDVDLARYPAISHLRHLMEKAGFGQLEEVLVDFPYALTDIAAYRNKAFTCLQMISADKFRHGIERMEEDLRMGPIIAFSRYLMLWATKDDPEWSRY
jgi:ubiquinone/menaquinone biosynthesis C-methylase UbiE